MLQKPNLIVCKLHTEIEYYILYMGKILKNNMYGENTDKFYIIS